ncbi:protein phosphatase 2C domain-containing protein [Mucilaginibacter sp. PAMB04168]|uniref:PP2C family protein-serine/threonine phosphatase n=1 Tax=Mucilaginibacter sp. PAMB04168 TaxID=3138567 RepID=UPI0031F705DB
MAENYFGLTDTGKVRGNNEDTFIAQKTTSNLVLACVIDGVGGYSGGEVAAAIARDEIIAQMDKVNTDFVPAMVQAFRLANKSIYARKQQEKELESMACVTTLAMVDVEKNQFYYAHVGDTRLYLLRDGSLVKISKDQSFVGFLEDSGRLSEAAAMSHPKRNEINKALGFDGAIDTDDAYIETGQSPFLPGDMLLLCSDGLSDLVDRNEITGIITQGTSLQQKASQLIESANNKGGKDNITVVLVQHPKASQQPAATVPPTALKKKDFSVREDKPKVDSVVESASTKQEPAKVIVKNNKGLSVILAVLCVAFLGSTVWFYRQWKSSEALVSRPVADTSSVKNAHNPDEVKLQQAIDKVTGDTVVLSDTVFKQPIIISDSIHIQKDTLYIRAKGNVLFKRDSSYNGPALALSVNCKHIVLDGVKFDGFAIGIQSHNTALELKKVQFLNCLQPLLKLYSFDLKNRVTSSLPAVTYTTDTLKNTSTKPNGNK